MQVFIIISLLKQAFCNLSTSLLSLRKYIIGITEPTIWLIPVASAAPNTPRFNTYMKNDKDFAKMQDLIEYDVLFGKSYYISDDEKPKKNKIKMGIDNVCVSRIEHKDNKILIHGENFTTNSRVYLNDSPVSKRFINENTLEVDEIDNLERVSVKQIGRNSVVLSSSDDFDYNSLNASK